ncbi:lipopolysaccharide biosynthesis protein [Archangium gephyra]|uniref:lipopolysaccharide biosynthesis protein n=1 Tax=Archangium gephyra TaxID=48 RepID=UPI003B792F03
MAADKTAEAAQQQQRGTSATRQALPLVLARMTAAVITVVTPLYLARKLSLEEYGTYKQIFLLCGPVLSILSLGMAQSLYYFVPRAQGPRAVLLQTQLFNLAMGFVGAGLLWAALPLAAERFPNPALLLFRGELAFFVLFSLAGGLLETTLTSQGRTRASALVYVGYEILKSVALVAPFLLGFGMKGAMAALAVLTLTRFCVTLSMVLSAEGGGPSWAGLRAQLAYALPFGAAMMISIPQQVAHQYAVALSVPPALYAVYAVGCFQVPLVDLFYSPTSEVLMVRVGQLDKQGLGAQAAALFREATRKLALVFIPASAFLVLSAPWVVRALFGGKFDAAVPIFRVSVLGIMLACLPMDGLLRARGQTRAIFFSYLGKAIATVPLLALLVPWLGMLGGILAWLLAEVVGKTLLLRQLPRALAAGGPLPALRDWLPVKELARLCGATGVCAVAVLAFTTRLGPVLETLGGREGAVLHVAVAGVLFTGALVPLLQVFGLRPLALLASLRR